MAKARGFAELFNVAGQEHTGVMIALYPSPDLAAQIAAVPGVETPADQLHVTLGFCGDANTLSDVEIAAAILAAQSISRVNDPLVGVLGGVGRFNASQAGGKDAVHASVDIPGLDRLRADLMAAAEAFGATVSDDHGFNPHITLAYVEPGTEASVSWETLPVRFDALSVCVGDRKVDFPLTGAAQVFGEMGSLCAQGRPWRLFNEYQFAEPPDWIPYLPIPGTFAHPAYGEITITPERNARFVDNFRAGVYQERLPLDAEHETKLSGAVGWIVDMRLNEDGSADARVEWTDRGRKLIESDRFRYVSPEFYDEWEDPATEEVHQDVAVGGAITTRPFFKEKALRPLIASETGLFVHFKQETPMADQTVSTKQFAELEKQFNELKDQLAASEAKAAESEAQSKTFADALDKATKRLAEMEDEQRREQYRQMAQEWPGDVEEHIKILEALAESNGEDSEPFQSYLKMNRAMSEQIRTSVLFSELGSSRQGSGSAIERVDQLIAKKMSDNPKLAYAEASAAVFRENPRLYGEYVKATEQKI